MKYQLFPNLTADEMEALTADIEARGVMVPVELDENGDILDGHHRAMIANSLGIGYPTVVRGGWTEDQKLVHVVALNAHRRQLTATERAEVVATLRKARLSTRAIAKAVGVDSKTVRNDLARGEVSPPDAVTGNDGKSYPAFRPRLDSLPYHQAPKAEPTPDYIEQMPPALAAEELEFRQRGKWGNQMYAALSALQSIEPTDYIDLLDSEERGLTDQRIDLIESWISRTRKAMSGGLRVIGGKR